MAFGMTQADNTLRPFARRRFRTWRPALVFIRARKPWARLRLSTLGWNVLFIALILGPKKEGGF